MDETLREVGSLLAVRGVTLWWRSPRDPVSVQLLGLIGSDMPLSLGKESSIYEQPFARLRSDLKPLSLSREGASDLPTLTSDKLPHLVLIPLKDQHADDLIGFITLHDAEPINLTPFFTDELLFLSQEIGQNIAEYMASRDRDDANRELIGHEVGTALRSIDSVRVRLEDFFLTKSRTGDAPALRMLGDIAAHIDTARVLLDYLTSGPIQEDAHSSHNDPIVNFYHYLNSQPQDKPISLRVIINDTFQPRIVDLRRKRIAVIQTSSIVPPLWARSRAVRQVFSNIVDNIVKYGSSGQRMLLDDGHDGLEYFVVIESRGAPLREELAHTPERVFERGLRGAKQAILAAQSGQGNGLYIASMLARSWGGAIRLTYKVEEGIAIYTFKVSFPLWLAQRSNPWLK